MYLSNAAHCSDEQLHTVDALVSQIVYTAFTESQPPCRQPQESVGLAGRSILLGLEGPALDACLYITKMAACRADW